MACRPKGYGMTAEIEEQMNSKYDYNCEKEVLEWISYYVPDAELEGVTGPEEVQLKLKDGVTLCKLINKLSPNSVPKINSTQAAFKQMENINFFLTACEGMGCLRSDLFQTVNLYEGTNMAQVLLGIYALGRKAHKLGLKGIGPKEADKNERQFTEDQLRAGEGTIGLQAGWNKGASQSGQNFGKTRSILD